MNQEVLNKLMKCYRYKDYKTAIFLAFELLKYSTEFKLLLGILLYENQEYARSIFHLKDLSGTTARFYQALNYKKIKKYVESIDCLIEIVEHKTQNENISNIFIQSFIIDNQDTEYFNSLLGQLYFLRGRSKRSIEKNRKSFAKNALVGPVLALFDENFDVIPVNNPISDPVMQLYYDLMKFNIQDKPVSSYLRNIYEARQNPDFQKYMSTGLGSYFISKIAAVYCKFGDQEFGLELFEILRECDPFYITDLDVYSTGLWVQKNENLLTFLSKELLSSHPNSHITWSVVGNYYSLKGKIKESSICLMKSINIQESPFAYSLLGFELNSKNQYSEAQTYFKSSICMLENNDKAYFGKGIALSETSRRESAESYFKKALHINKNCMNMKVYFVRFYVGQNDIQKALDMALEYLNIKSNDYNFVANYVLENIGNFTELQELLICEIAGIFNKLKMNDLARKVIESVQCRTSTYYKKKCIIENED